MGQCRSPWAAPQKLAWQCQRGQRHKTTPSCRSKLVEADTACQREQWQQQVEADGACRQWAASVAREAPAAVLSVRMPCGPPVLPSAAPAGSRYTGKAYASVGQHKGARRQCWHVGGKLNSLQPAHTAPASALEVCAPSRCCHWCIATCIETLPLAYSRGIATCKEIWVYCPGLAILQHDGYGRPAELLIEGGLFDTGGCRGTGRGRGTAWDQKGRRGECARIQAFGVHRVQ